VFLGTKEEEERLENLWIAWFFWCKVQAGYGWFLVGDPRGINNNDHSASLGRAVYYNY